MTSSSAMLKPTTKYIENDYGAKSSNEKGSGEKSEMHKYEKVSWKDI